MNTEEYLNTVEKQSKHMLWCVRMLRKGRSLRRFGWYPGSHIKLNKEGGLVFVSYNGTESPSKLQHATYFLVPRTNPHKVGTWKWARWEAKHNGAKQLARRVYDDPVGCAHFLDGVFSVGDILAKDWYVMSLQPRQEAHAWPS